MDPDKEKTVNFVIVPTMKEREVVGLVLDRCPDVRERLCPEEYYFDLATVVYDTFSTIVIERADDPRFIQSVAFFLDELAENKDRLVQEVLIVCLLEGIAAEEKVARMIERTMTPHSRSLLHDVERSFYGRSPKTETTQSRARDIPNLRTSLLGPSVITRQCDPVI